MLSPSGNILMQSSMAGKIRKIVLIFRRCEGRLFLTRLYLTSLPGAPALPMLIFVFRLDEHFDNFAMKRQ